MTETVSGGRKATEATKAGRGLTIQRRFSTEGIHPYDELTWERRDVVQTNWKTGEVVFEQHGVEFPDFWSVNASTIVTTKYFRGALGTPAREQRLRQLIHRARSEEHRTELQSRQYLVCRLVLEKKQGDQRTDDQRE